MLDKTRYLNFSPSDGFQLYVNGLIDRLNDISPSDSSMNSAIEQIDGRFMCKLEINSRTGSFHARSESNDAKKAVEEARRRVLRMLVKWRHERVFA